MKAETQSRASSVVQPSNGVNTLIAKRNTKKRVPLLGTMSAPLQPSKIQPPPPTTSRLNPPSISAGITSYSFDDPADSSHIVSFSGDTGRRSNENLYDLPVDRMLLNSKNQPKVDGLPVPTALKSAGRCVQLGNFATGHVTSVVCSATDRSGKRYDLRFESDGSPITVRRVNPSAPSIRQRG